MSSGQCGIDTAGFVPASVRRVAPGLDAGRIHLWRLHYQRHQGRAPLKAVLAAYLGVEPARVSLTDDTHGRPHLIGAQALDFNWSHSGNHAVVAVARDLPELGVDIEQRRDRPRALALAERFFAESEHALLRALPPAHRNEAFLRLWTAKEAVLKAHGRGLAYGLERVEFALHGSGVRALRFRGEVGDSDQWQCVALAPDPVLAGALAWRGKPRRIGRFVLTDADVADA